MWPIRDYRVSSLNSHSSYCYFCISYQISPVSYQKLGSWHSGILAVCQAYTYQACSHFRTFTFAVFSFKKKFHSSFCLSHSLTSIRSLLRKVSSDFRVTTLATYIHLHSFQSYCMSSLAFILHIAVKSKDHVVKNFCLLQDCSSQA